MAFALLSTAYSSNIANGSGSYSGTTGTLATAIASIPADSLILLSVNTYSAISSVAVTDTGSLTWTQIGSIENSTSPVSNVLLYAVNASALTSWKPTIHISSAQPDEQITVAIFSGVDTSNPLGGYTEASGTNSTPSTTLSPVPGSLVYCNVDFDVEGYLAPAAGYTTAVLNPPLSSGYQDNNDYDPQLSIYKLSASATETPGGTIETSSSNSTPQSGPWTVVSAWFNAASSSQNFSETGSGTVVTSGATNPEYGFKEHSVVSAATSGTATPVVKAKFSETASGTTLTLGTTNPKYSFKEYSQVSVTTSGSATEITKSRFSETASGTADFSGQNAPTYRYSFTESSSGASLAAGQTNPRYTFKEPSEGILATSSVTNPKYSFKELSSGSVQTSGNVQLNQSSSIHETASGNVTVNGLTNYKFSFKESSNGIAAASGSINPKYQFNESASITAILSGNVQPNQSASIYETASGNVTVNGLANYKFNFKQDSSGTVATSEQINPRYTLRQITNGNALINGATNPKYQFKESSSGQFILSGNTSITSTLPFSRNCLIEIVSNHLDTKTLLDGIVDIHLDIRNYSDTHIKVISTC